MAVSSPEQDPLAMQLELEAIKGKHAKDLEEIKGRYASRTTLITVVGTVLAAVAGLGGVWTGRNSSPDSRPNAHTEPVPVVLPTDTNTFQRLLEAHDPNTFNGFHPEKYRVARVYPNRSWLEKGDFGTLLSNSKATLDIAVINGRTVLGNEFSVIEEALKNPRVRVRIVVFDVSKKNQAKCDALAQATGGSCQELRDTYAHIYGNLKDMHDKLKDDPKRFKVFAYPEVLLYTMWIRDADEPSRMALLRVHMRRNRKEWPSFVVSEDGEELIKSLSDEFKNVLARSTAVDLDKPVPE